MYERWSFADGVYQPATSGADSVLIESASQFSVPVAVTLPFGTRWSVDLSTAYASGRVRLGNGGEYALSGITDTRVRVTGRLTDALILTLGANLPTGHTDLDSDEFNALRILAAPALSFQVPTIGSGFSGTGGMVIAKEVGGWALAFGTSYEVRGGYSPGAVAAGIFVDDFNPSDAFRLSLGADRLLGPHGMTLGISADIFASDRLTTAPSGVNAAPQELATRLGPILTFDWQLRIASRGFRELTLYAIDRYRTTYKRDDVTVDGSSGNYLDAGVRSVHSISRSGALLTAVNLRHQTGLKVDNALSTAAMASGALTVGWIQQVGRLYTLQPFVRGQVGRLKSGEQSTSVTGLAAGMTFGVKF
jgi:hypothetical protein